MVRHKVHRILAVFAVTLIAASCAAPPPPEQGLRYRINEDPPTLDPFRAGDDNSYTYIYQIFDGLVEFVPGSLDVRPAVAESWTVSPDGLTYTFKLRRGVRFHNDREVTAGDVLYSLRRALTQQSKSEKRSFYASLAGASDYWEGKTADLAGVSSPDPHTVVITLAYPYAPFLSVLASEAGSILPEEIYSDPGEAYLKRPVGCGPFQLESWDPGVSLTLKRFAQHWKGPGQPGSIQKITVRMIKNASTALEEYRAGHLDYTFEIPPGQREKVRSEMPEHFTNRARLAIFYLGFNHESDLLKNNPKLRRAISHAIDREFIVRVLQEGKDLPATGIIPPAMLGHVPGGVAPYDPEAASRLLAEAGYPGGAGLPEIIYRSNETLGFARIADRIQSDLGRVGIKVAIKMSDFGAFLQELNPAQLRSEGALHLFRFTWFPDWPDPDSFLAGQFATGAAGNFGLYGNPVFDAIADQARREASPTRRDELYRQAEKILLDDAALVPIYWYGQDMLLRPGFEGMKPSPLGPFAIAWEEVIRRG